MLLVHEKDQQWKNPLTSLATYPCRVQTNERTWVNCKLSTALHQNSEPGSYAAW